MNVELYFVALVKHDAPQFVVAGPYREQAYAEAEAAKRSEGARSYGHVVMKTTLELELCE